MLPTKPFMEFAPLRLCSKVALHKEKGERGVQVLSPAHQVLASCLYSCLSTSSKESGSLLGPVSTVCFPLQRTIPLAGCLYFPQCSIWEEALSRLSISDSSSGGFLLKMF